MYAIVLDTETTNTLEDPICYDIGWGIINLEDGSCIKTRSYAVAEIFLDKDLMKEAYFAEKIPSYWDEIKANERILARLVTIKRQLRNDCKKYEIKEIYAHNARFDYVSCSLTQRWLTSSKWRFFFPYGVTICDTLKMARKAFENDESYKLFCEENAYKTQNGGNRYTAEIIYRFLSGDNSFEEVHKGIDDVLIEKEILMECRKRGVKSGALWEK